MSRQLEVHYINTGFPYSVTESFMDFFEGLVYTPPHPLDQLQEEEYWCMSASPYKYGYSGPTSSFSYLFQTGGSGHLPPTMEEGWESPAISRGQPNAAPVVNPHPSPEECVRNQYTVGPGPQDQQMYWQNNINPDNMTYEELLDLGEAVGTQNRGLSPDLIAKLPVTKYKCSFFLRKKKRCERCVICQMDFKRKDSQMTLPCKHVYHSGCIKRWLGINKACPICYVEVFGEGSKC